MKRQALVLGALLACGAVSFAADKPEKPRPPAPPAYLREGAAGSDYQTQGEYEGTAGAAKLGVQVIALGNGKFQAVFYPGGLPGAGSDGKTKMRVDGRRDGMKALFEGRGVSAVIDGDTLTGKDAQGQAVTAKKVSRRSPTLGMKPPEGAIVLFDGISEGGALREGRVLLGVPVLSRQEFTDFTMHLEFILPFMPTAGGQGRGNSGVYPQGRYEIQVLDSFGLEGENNECGGVYQNAKPIVNMCFPPLVWQTYDIDFTAARWDGNRKTADAVLTVKHNGVTIHDQLKLKGPTPGGPKSGDEKGPGPLHLQDHGDPVFYRNIWIVEKK